MTPGQCRAARALLNLGQVEVAAQADLSRSTLVDFEKGERIPRPVTVMAIRTALEGYGVVFLDENGNGPGVALRKRN